MKLNIYKLLVFFFLTAWASLPGWTQSDMRRTDALITNQGVQKVEYANGYTMLSGYFNTVGPYSGSGVVITTTSTTRDEEMPIVNGYINTSLPDGSGGWYIGGYFQLVDTVKIQNLAHIKADKTVDRTWKPDPAGTVYAMIIGNGTLYIGGYFQQVNKQTRNFLAAFDTASGSLKDWNPNSNDVVYSLAANGTTVYAGGYFTTVSGLTHNKIVALDGTTGKPTAWNPAISGTNASVNSIIATPTIIYAAGYFTGVGAASRSSLAAINATTGAATAWNPPVSVTGTVHTMLLNGNTLYVGGYLTIKGSAAVNLVAINTSTGAGSTTFIPQFDTYSVPNALVLSGNTLYVGGYFSGINGFTRNGLAALKTSDGSLLSWAPEPTGDVSTISIDGTNLFIGGSFNGINWLDRSGFALLDDSKNTAWPFGFSLNGGVINSIAVKDNVLYVGGQFSAIDRSARGNLAAFDLTTGALLPWAPSANYTTATSNPAEVTTLIIKDNILYVGGRFGNINNAGKNTAHINFAALDLTSGTPTALTINVGSTNFDIVNSMDLTGNTLYVAGTFNLNKKTNLAAIDVTAGTVLPWAPNSNGNVTRIRVTSTTAYVVGDFANGVGGAIRNHHIAAIDLTTAKATAWNPSFNSDVNDIALSATDLYVGGYFDGIDTATYYGGLASFSLSTGNTTLWRPDVRGNSDSQPDIQSLATSNNRLHAGGSFDYVHDYADEARTNYVEYDLCPNAFNLTINGSVLTAPTADSYQWFINNIPIDGAISQTFQINQGEYGAYHVELLLHSCTGRSNDYVNLVTAQESADPHSIKIYPNPFQEEFFIDVPESSTLTMLNVMGQVVKTSALEAAQTNRVETHGLNRGTYILVVRSAVKTNYLRIIKTY